MFPQSDEQPKTQIVGCGACHVGYTVVPTQTRVVTPYMDGLVVTTTLYANFLKFVIPTYNVGLLCQDCGAAILGQYELK